MFLVRFALRNPHAVWAVAIGLSLLGLSQIPKIPADILPDFKTPVVVSYFSYPGMPPLEIEKSVSARVERILTLASDIEHQEARSVPGACVIKVAFHPGTDPAAALNEIINLEANDMHHLPPDIDWPFTLRSEPANLPVVLASISGQGLSETELYKIGYYAVRNKMGGLKGVQIPHPFGGKFRQMMVYVDPDKLRAHDLAPTDVVEALTEANLVMAGGTMKLGNIDYQVHTVNTLPTAEDISNIPVAVRDGKPIFIRDIGYAKDDAAIQNNIVRVNGKRSVYCPLHREPGENSIEVVDRIREGLAREVPLMKARGEIPEAAEINLVSDQSSYIRNAIRNLEYEVGLGGVLVMLVIGFFLRRFLPSVAVLMVMPLSILIGFLGFYFSGNTINVMTLGGVALAIGNVVDASIVVVENIVRHLAMGKPSKKAVSDAVEEVATPILAGTVTTLVVFVPVIFLSGMIRYLFEPLTLAAATTIAASYFLSMTVIPAFCVKMLKTDKTLRQEQTDLPEPTGRFAGLLKTAMNNRLPVVLGGLAIFALSLFLYPHIGSELFPDVDAGVFEVRVKTTPGTRIEETEKLVIKLEEVIKEIIPEKEIETLMANIGLPTGKGAGFSTMLSPNSGPDTAFFVVTLHPEGRKTSTREYVRRLRKTFAEKFPQDQFLFVSGGVINAALNEGVATPINVQVSAGTTAATRAAAERVVERVRQIEGTADVQIAQALDYPQFDVRVDRTRAAYFGLSQKTIAENISTALTSSIGHAETIWVDPKTGVDFYMGVQYKDNEVRSLDELRNLPLPVKTEEGPTTIPLSEVADIVRVNIPGEIAHYNLSRVNDVYVNVTGRDLGSVARDVEKAVAEMKFESGVATTLRGPVAKMKTDSRSLGWGLLTAIILVYLIMMAQFRSLVDPLIILLAVPLGLTGVLGILWLTNTTLNIQSLMGTLMMIGVVVNNSILLVDFANHLRKQGISSAKAAWMAGCVRLRPILMTALVLVASMLPLSMNLAPGSEAMIPLARALIGGMLVSTILTLFLVPCVYAIVKPNPQTVAA
ncbi:MAG TPA: efflux RND transporter permease subunit [Verrucomicrobiales bacterium]|nr:efflux RND transporter permease subunit [Verrucomicrobiales bacterium]